MAAGSLPNNFKLKSAFHFENHEALAIWLTAKGIDISGWGCGTKKSVENLWEELVCGEIVLQDNPLLRVVPVVQIIIHKGEYILIEAMQEFADKRRRRRNHPPSEKMKPGETYLEAATRCLREELGVTPQDIEFLPQTYRGRQEETESPSYPGLRTKYTFHVIEAKVAGLPNKNFWTNEIEQNQTDAIKKHYWVWQKATDSEIFG